MALTDLELAVSGAPGNRTHNARLIRPESMDREKLGRITINSIVCNILPITKAFDSRLVVEVITLGGCWSSYPPYKHDSDNFPEESPLEKYFLHRLKPSMVSVSASPHQDASIDETMNILYSDKGQVHRDYHSCTATVMIYFI